VPRLSAVFASIFWVAFGAGVVGACSSSCPGVEVNGQCQTRCEDSACPATFKCVNNACRPPCAASSDCSSLQKCENVETDYGATGHYCYGPAGTTGDACTTSSDCDALHGFDCITGKCTQTCVVHGDCGSLGSCTGTAKTAAGAAVRTCVKDAFPRGPGQYGTPCPLGSECDAKDDFVCMGNGRTGGVVRSPDAGTPTGDVDGYCTKLYSNADSDCPTGFSCDSEQTSRLPCTDTCGITGKAGGDCVDASDIGDGKRFQCATLTLLSNVCVHRSFCSECATDADCLGEPGQVCAKDSSGQKICTVQCDPAGNSCPWGSATSCQVTDTDLGYPTCSHRFGACKGTGKSCEPCVDQKDCPTGFCNEEPFTGEQYCVDLAANCTCPATSTGTCLGGGCPTTPAPGVLEMTCYGGSSYMGGSIYEKCFGASDPGSMAASEGCWPH
jgi:hypothetical protein